MAGIDRCIARRHRVLTFADPAAVHAAVAVPPTTGPNLRRCTHPAVYKPAKWQVLMAELMTSRVSLLACFADDGRWRHSGRSVLVRL